MYSIRFDDVIEKFKVDKSVVGIDLSVNNIGIVAITPVTGWLDAVLIGKSKRADVSISKDLPEIAEQVISWVKSLHPEIVYIEDYAYHPKATASITVLAELTGIVKYLLKKENILYEVLPIPMIKKAITGKGNADKNLIMLKCYQKFGIDFSERYGSDSEHVFDALCVAMTPFILEGEHGSKGGKRSKRGRKAKRRKISQEDSGQIKGT